MTSNQDNSVKATYELLRKKLVDTTMRNRLINYRSSKTVGVDVVEESSDSVWRLLVVDLKRMGFTGPPDPPKVKRDDVEEQGALYESGFFDAEPIEVGKIDTEDLLLNTSVTHTKLQMRLLHSWRQASAQLDEQGINTLFLALGMLEWKQSDAAESTSFAPLILVPVVLEKTTKGTFKLAYDENDIGANLSLATVLSDQHLKLPSIPSDLAGFTPTEYFREVRDAISSKPDWVVHENKVSLGFFSYAKVVIYHDLDEARWSEGQSPCDHKDVSAALGSGYDHATHLLEVDRIDSVRTPSDALEVFSADSSQLLAIMEANRGTSLVIEGPPGTGKSQTIANLIAECVYSGKKVLFVSEKIAALEVVYRRLESAGLQEACIEIHSQKASRKAFYNAVSQTWKLRSRLPDAGIHLERLADLRNSLNLYADEIHRPLPKQGVSPRFLIGKCVGLPSTEESDLDAEYDGAALKDISWFDFERLQPYIAALQAKVQSIGSPKEHPFFECGITYLGPTERLGIERSVKESLSSVRKLIESLTELTHSLGVEPPNTIASIASLSHCIEVASSAPKLEGVPVAASSWVTNSDDLRELICSVRRLQEIKSQNSEKVLDQAWGKDFLTEKSAFERYAEKPLKFLFGDYRKAKARLLPFLTPVGPSTPPEQRALLQALVEFDCLRKQIHASEALLQSHFGVQWLGERSNPDSLDQILTWILDVDTKVRGGQLPRTIWSLLSGQFDAFTLSESYRQVTSNASQTNACLEHTCKVLDWKTEKDTRDLPLDDVLARMERFDQSFARLSEIVDWNILSEEIESKGLAEILAFATQWRKAGSSLLDHVLRVWLHAGIREAFDSRPSLRKFERSSHEQAIAEFKKLDDILIAHNRARTVHAHLQAIPSFSQVGLSAGLSRQCNLQRGHRPIRWAYEQFSELLLRIKPVTMMSPISVATFLPSNAELFDVVIFDEASQIKPEDALSAIARAKQAIVVGDTKQMPPTSFFDSLDDDNEADTEAEYDSAVGKMESVLALFNAIADPSGRKTDLRWHYRSLHQALIQPSNRLFYNDRLIVFPSPVYATNASESDLGLRFHYDPNTTYDRGSTRKINRGQAVAVAEAIVEHIKTRPHESILAVAFSKHQQEAIQDELEIRERADPGLFSTFSQMHPVEPLRVKNLETVQGDERDVIYVSVGYGRDEKGKISMNFGPLNKEGGGRRLNVLISRAKKRTEVFTSIRSGDIRFEGDNLSLHAFKTFLEFAETGILDVPTPTGQEPESVFEEEVMAELTNRGYMVDPQVGTLGFRIDLAVRHPKMPGRYAIGIECDGATYHSAKSARDRDKLRESVLLERNWKLHRIWSTDWWRDRDACLNRCLDAIERAIKTSDEEEMPTMVEEPQVAEETSIEIWSTQASSDVPKGRPYNAWNQQFNLQGSTLGDIPAPVMAKAVATVAAFEGPIHRDLLVRRIRESCNISRAGSRIQAAVDAGIHFANSSGEIRYRDGFIYWNGQAEIVARDRSQLDTSDRMAEYIPPEEIDRAIQEVLVAASAASIEDLNSGLRTFFGFGRTPGALPDIVSSRVKQLQETNLVSKDNLLKWLG